MPLMFASDGIGFGGTNSAAFMRLASPPTAAVASLACAVAESDRPSPPTSPPPHEINNAATGDQAAKRPARPSRSMAHPPRASLGLLLFVTQCSAADVHRGIPRTRGRVCSESTNLVVHIRSRAG